MIKSHAKLARADANCVVFKPIPHPLGDTFTDRPPFGGVYNLSLGGTLTLNLEADGIWEWNDIGVRYRHWYVHRY